MRNTIGKLGVGAIEDHIKELSAADGKKWLLRSKRPDGPLFWESPCPEGCPISPKADGYQVCFSQSQCLELIFIF